MNISQGYKQTELGIIPDDWQIVTIGQIADITTGNKNTQDAEDYGKYPFYVRSQNIERINSFTYDSEGVVTAGDGVGTGKIFHYVNGKFGLHQRVYLIHNFKSYDIKYFFWYFSQNFYDRINQMTAKSSVDSVRKDMIDKMAVLQPPLSEQKAIAEALSSIDNLIETLDKKIAKKRLIKQGAMQQLLTGKKRLPGFTEEWVEKKFEQIFIHISTKKSQVDTSKYQIIGKYPILDQSQNNIVGYTDNVNPIVCKPDGAIIFGDHTRIFKYTNHAFYVGADGTQVLFCKDDICTKFMYHLCCILEIPNTGYNRHYKYLKEFIYIIPESKKEQETIATILSDMDKEIEELETRKEKCRLIKAGMMQKLLTGQIRLKTK